MKVLKRFNKKIYCLSCVFEINSVLLQTKISSKIVKGGFSVLLEIVRKRIVRNNLV